MKNRHPNYRLVKTHRNYTVEEIATLFSAHKNTVRNWIKQGLPTSDDLRPMLILGRELATFLETRRNKNKRTCQPGELYCFRCRAPKKPAADMADYMPLTDFVGNLIALCTDCDSIMNRRISVSKLALFQREMDITFPRALRHISERNQRSVNSDFK